MSLRQIIKIQLEKLDCKLSKIPVVYSKEELSKYNNLIDSIVYEYVYPNGKEKISIGDKEAIFIKLEKIINVVYDDINKNKDNNDAINLYYLLYKILIGVLNFKGARFTNLFEPKFLTTFKKKYASKKDNIKFFEEVQKDPLFVKKMIDELISNFKSTKQKVIERNMSYKDFVKNYFDKKSNKKNKYTYDEKTGDVKQEIF